MIAPAVFHLATPHEWAEAQRVGSLAPLSLTTEGFVHCSTDDQLAATIERHFAGIDQLVLLRLDPVRLADALQWDESRPGEVFPHVYRALDLEDVVEVVPWHRSPGAPGA